MKSMQTMQMRTLTTTHHIDKEIMIRTTTQVESNISMNLENANTIIQKVEQGKKERYLQLSLQLRIAGSRMAMRQLTRYQ